MPGLAGTLISAINLTPGKERILSNRVRIFFRDLLSGNKILLGELDNFSFKQRDNIKIRKPAGFYHEVMTQYEPGGWDLEFSGGKVDWRLMRLMVRQSQVTAFNNAAGIVTELAHKSKNFAPLIDIEYTVYHFSGSIEQYIFGQCILYNFDGIVNGDMAEVTENFKGFCPVVYKGGAWFAIDEALSGITNAAAALVGGHPLDNTALADSLIDNYIILVDGYVNGGSI